MEMYEIHRDAFSSGQIGSKIWLCKELEKLFDSIDNIWIYGGWYGVAAFLLKARANIKIGKISSYDMDPTCEPVADMLNENWVYDNWQFKAFTEDCNKLIPDEADLIINTSTEHFESTAWFENIPKGKVVALQGNNMPHEDHHTTTDNLTEFCKQFKLSTTLFAGEKEFVYPDWKFSRYMVIGIK